jgi:hypothetical protein
MGHKEFKTWRGQSKRRMKFHKRITVRLDDTLTQLLASQSRIGNQSLSEIVRSSLEFALVPRAPEKQESRSVGSEQEIALDYIFPADLKDLLPKYRPFGTEIWIERRRCFQALLAICEVARELSRNARDQTICVELLALGRRLGLCK